MEYVISVVVPVYNVEEKYLRQCVESIISQTYKNLEIILVDDGSTDGSADICDEYAERDNRVKVIHKPNGGVVSSRKAGVAVATGDYVGMVDCDDWIDLDMYESLLKIAVETDADCVESGRFYEKDGSTTKELPPCSSLQKVVMNDKKRRELLFGLLTGEENQIMISTIWLSKLLKRNLVQFALSNISDIVTCADDAIGIMYCIQEAKSIVFVNKYYYHYRLRQGSISRQHNFGKVAMGYITFLESMYQFLEHYHYEEKYKLYANCMFVRCIDRLAIRVLSKKEKLNIHKYPNEKILKGKKVVLYGAGEIGKLYYKRYNRLNEFDIICWADKRYLELKNADMEIQCPTSIKNYDFDYILIAVNSELKANEIKDELIRSGIDANKILWDRPIHDFKWMY